MLAFFRSLGGLLGVTGSGAIVNWQLRSASATASAAESLHAVAERGLKQVASLSPDVIAVYRHALASTFFLGVCIVAVALVAILFMPERALSHEH